MGRCSLLLVPCSFLLVTPPSLPLLPSGHDENVQLFMTKTGMSNNDYVQNVSERQAHVQVDYVQVGYVQVKFVTLLDILNSSELSTIQFLVSRTDENKLFIFGHFSHLSFFGHNCRTNLSASASAFASASASA